MKVSSKNTELAIDFGFGREVRLPVTTSAEASVPGEAQAKVLSFPKILFSVADPFLDKGRPNIALARGNLQSAKWTRRSLRTLSSVKIPKKRE